MSGESSETKETDCVAGPASSAGGASQVLSSSSAAATVATAATANNRRQAKGTAAAAASTTPERSPPSASVRGSPPDQQQLVTMFQALTPGAEAPRGELGGGAAGARPTTAAAAAQPGSAPAGKNISVPPRHPQPHSGRKNAGGADRSGAPGTKAAAAAGSTVGGVGSGSSGGSGLGGSSAADAIARRRPGEEGSALAEQRAPMEGLAEVPSEALAAAVIAAIVPTEGAVPKGNIASGTSGGARNSLGAWWSHFQQHSLNGFPAMQEGIPAIGAGRQRSRGAWREDGRLLSLGLPDVLVTDESPASPADMKMMDLELRL
ncbi:unnamed protein product [Closterium sp. NIES-65]|nr:unnamed protein product [Closterium sp. NIES-65]